MLGWLTVAVAFLLNPETYRRRISEFFDPTKPLPVICRNVIGIGAAMIVVGIIIGMFF